MFDRFLLSLKMAWPAAYEEPEELPAWQSLPGQRKLFKIEELAEKTQWLKDLSGDNQQALLKSLKKLEKKGPWRNVSKAPVPEVLDALHADFPNFSAVTTLIQQRLLLCGLAPDKHIKLPPILLNGPAGVGKTAYCQRLAALLLLRFEKIDLSSAVASFTMTGLDAGYGSGHPGRIWESLQNDSLSVLWLLDELEKTNSESRHGGNQYLLGLLEPVSAERFTDNCTLLPIDASWICYIATSNSKELIDSPLLSRFEVFDIPAPDASQLRAIVSSIYRDIRHSEAWAPAFGETLGEEVINALSGYTPREIRRLLINGFAAAAGQSRRILQAGDIRAKTDLHIGADRRIGFF
ncbi:ATP-dependent Lon protease [Polaromonas sp. CG_9.5]|uniref:AAA family ATPase n=1 Tax=Polaromonas sp. CG_9.5 TaxID=3071705 RepID=UPI002DF9C8DF|nr:ATP-dependent Lon protease [Polaromonas sp. CG_9.5]